MNRFLDLFVFLTSDLPKIQKSRIIFGYLILSRYGCIKILGIKLHFSKGLRNHSLLILKEIFLSQIYAFTSAVDQKLKVHQDSIIIDIGANIGISTAYFIKKYPNVKLIAIEASPINYKQLVNNIQLNKFENVTTLNCFVSNTDDKIQFHHDLYKPGGSFGAGFRFKSGKNLEVFEVKTKKLSEIIRGHKNIVIKIDVEGAEYVILEDLALSKDISEVLEITVEVSTFNLTDYNNLNIALNSFYHLGFEGRLISDNSVRSLKDKSRGAHLQLVLFRDLKL